MGVNLECWSGPASVAVWRLFACCCVARSALEGKQFLATLTGASRVGRQEILMLAQLVTAKLRGM